MQRSNCLPPGVRSLQAAVGLTASLVVVVTLVGNCRAAENLWLDSARASITFSELHGHVAVLADDTFEGREAGSRGGRAAAKYLIDRLKQANLQPAGDHGRYTQRFGHNYQNLLAVLEGTDPELRDEYLVLGAHYDHVGYGNRRNSFGPIGYIHNGADDNASGVAAVLEVIDALAHSDFRPRRSLLFAFWDGEEKGLLGSKHWVSRPTIPLQQIRLAMNVDMVGRVEGGRIEVGGTRTGEGFRQLLSTNRVEEGTWLDFSWEYKDNSDHYTFFQAGVPSLYVHSGLHDDYHRPSDDVEKINVEGIRESSRYLLEKMSALAEVDELPRFRSQARFETPSTQQREQHELPPLASRLGFQWDFVSGPTPLAVVRRVTRRASSESELHFGDQIVGVEGQPLVSEAQLPAAALRAEEQLQLSVVRPGTDQPLVVTATLLGEPVRLGMSWREDPAEPQTVYLTRVVPFSPAATAGLKVHDRIYALDGKSFANQEALLADIQQRLAEDAGQLQLRVESRGVLQEVIVPLNSSATLHGDPTL